MRTERITAIQDRQDGVRFEDFFRAEYPSLVRMLLALTGDRSEAEELAQEAMARTFEQWSRVQRFDSPAGYTYRTALNLNRKRLRHLATRARKAVLLRPREEGSTPAETRGALSMALASLPRSQRDAVILTEWVGLKAEEAGRLLGIKAASVRSRVNRAKASLREQLGGADE